MRTICFVGVLVWCIPLFVHASVRITEVAWMGTTESQYSEWLELYNDGSESVNLAGWKLLEGSGATIFTLTKTIGSGEYLLVERTTASAPDAVPSVNDESGPFGGGGLANTGEDITLVTSGGVTEDELDYASGWPAGDATTKETMQWNGSGWSTAPATPKKGYDGSGAQEPDDADELPTDPIPTVSPNKPGIQFVVPKTVWVHTEYEYIAKPMLEFNYQLLTGDLLWNMGDGTLIHQNTVAPIYHTYEYPGTYTIHYSYKDPYNEHQPLEGTVAVVVKSPELVASSTDNGKAVLLENNSSQPVDLSGWSLAADGRSIALPVDTVVAAKAQVVLPLRAVGVYSAKQITLIDPSGSVLTIPKIVSVSTPVDETVYDPIDTQDFVAEASSGVVERTTSSTPIQKRAKYIIFGALALFVIGLSILLERFMARQEYSSVELKE